MGDDGEEHTELEQLGGELVMYAARLVRSVRRSATQPAGLRVLSILDDQGPLGVTQLADVDRCSQPTMSGAVRTLAGQGCVRKVTNPADARSSLVELTTTGRRTLKRFRRAHGRWVAERLATGHNSPQDLAHAVAVLRDVLASDPASDHAIDHAIDHEEPRP